MVKTKLDIALIKIIKTLTGEWKPADGLELDAERVLDRELEQEQISYPPDFWTKTIDFLENIRIHQETLLKIKGKYQYHFVDSQYGLPDELIHQAVKQESYLRKYGLTPEHLPSVTKLVRQRIDNDIYLAEVAFHFRDDNCAVYELEKALKLERDPQRLKQLEKIMAEARAKSDEINRDRISKINHRNDAKWKITLDIMADLKSNLNPYYPEKKPAKYRTDWENKLALLKTELTKKGIYLNKSYETGEKHQAVIIQTWTEINQKMRRVRREKLGLGEEKELPPFDWDGFKKEISKRYPDPKFNSISVLRADLPPEKFSKAMQEFYERQIKEAEAEKPRSLEERVQEVENKKLRSKTRDRSVPDISKVRT